MTSTTFGLVILLSQSVLGGHKHRDKDDGVVRCEQCGVEKSALLDQIVRLQNAPKWRDRERAAHSLRRFNWRCHPEAAEVLAYSLLNDGNDEVREEAAQSLTKMGPCLPVVHIALSRAASADPDRSTRHAARKGLKVFRHPCDGPCLACGTVVGDTPVVVPGATILGIPAGPLPPAKLAPPIDSRVEPSARSPRTEVPETAPLDLAPIPLEGPAETPPAISPPLSPLPDP